MKRKSVTLVVFFLCAMMLTACAGKPTEKTDEPTDGKLSAEITVQVESGWKTYYESVAKTITEAYPDAKITLKEIGSFDHLDLLNNTDATNPDFADVFALPVDRFTDLAEKEVLATIDAPAIAKELGGFADYEKGLGGNLKFKGQYLAFPYNIETLVNFVNVANATEQGIDYTQPIELMDVKDAKTVLLPLFDAWFGVAVTNSAAITLLNFDKDGKLFSDLTAEFADLDADKKALIEAVYQYWKLNADSETPLFDAEAGWGYINDSFATGGKGIVRLGGPWETSGNVDRAGEQNLEVYPINHITIHGKPLVHWQGGWGLGINSRIEEDAAKMTLATTFIKELVNPKNAIALYEATGKILENVNADVYQNSNLSALDKKVITNVIASYQVSTPRPLFKEFGKVWDTWKNAILSWNSIKPQDAEAAYKELKASFDAMMANFQQ